MSNTIVDSISAAAASGLASVKSTAPVSVIAPLTAQAANVADTAELQRVATQLQNHYAATDSRLDFSVDAALGVIVVTVTDASNGKVLRQIPSEEALRIARFIDSGRSALIEARA